MKKKIFALDDERIYLKFLKERFKDCDFVFETNPNKWLDYVNEVKPDLNQYDYIICDYYFDNIAMSAFELKLSKYIREYGFNNYLVLCSNLSHISQEALEKNEFFDAVYDKNIEEIYKGVNNLSEESVLRKKWKSRES